MRMQAFGNQLGGHGSKPITNDKFVFTVFGTAAPHRVEVVRKSYATLADWDAAYRRGEYRDADDTYWQCENGAEFKTVGAATGWLKKFLKKHGWPEPTNWTIYVITIGNDFDHPHISVIQRS